MNYMALDEALEYIELGVTNEDFVLRSIDNDIAFITESINIFNEAEESVKVKFIDKIKNAIKKALEAIGKFFKYIWSKFTTFLKDTKRQLKQGAITQAMQYKANTDPEFKKFMVEDKQFSVISGMFDFFKRFFTSTWNAPEDEIKKPEEYITAELAKRRESVAADKCIELYFKAVDDLEKVKDKLDEYVKDLNRSKEILNKQLNELKNIADSTAAKVADNYARDGGFDDIEANASLIHNNHMAKMEGSLKLDELHRVNNILKVSTVTIKAATKEVSHAQHEYESAMEQFKKFSSKAEKYSEEKKKDVATKFGGANVKVH